MSKFMEWAERIGFSELARKCGVHRSTVSKWKAGHHPTAEHCFKILSIAKGALTLADLWQIPVICECGEPLVLDYEKAASRCSKCLRSQNG